MALDTARNIEIEAAEARKLLAAIAECIDGDEEAAHDAIEGETGLLEAFDRALVRMQEIDILTVGIEAHMERLRARKERLAQQEERLRAVIFSAMKMVGLKKAERPLATLSIGKTRQSVIVEDVGQLPVWLKSLGPWVPDKKAIGDTIKAGGVVSGAYLSPVGEQLNIRGL